METDAHAVSSAEELDEDCLWLDPLEAAMDPPERWSEIDKYGMTPYEQSHPRGLTDRLSEEQPDVQDTLPDLDVDTKPRSEQDGELDAGPDADDLTDDPDRRSG